MRILLTACLVLIGASAAMAAPKPACDRIDRAISANEDFVEIALAGDTDATMDALSAVREGFDAVAASLPKAEAAQVRNHIDAIEAAVTAGDLPGAAMAALDVYRVLVGAFETRLPTTLDVAMLDYTGFRLTALAGSPKVDWNAVAETVKEADVHRAGAERQLKDKALADLTGHIQTGLRDAAAAKNKDWLTSTAQIQLDTVDLLERAIKNSAKEACR